MTVSWRAVVDLLLISFVLLFLELACIRWFSAHVLFLTFFTNSVMLACFLGMALGCLVARQQRTHLIWTPLVLTAALGAGVAVEVGRHPLEQVLDVGNQASPDVVFFGTEYNVDLMGSLGVPMEIVVGFFFVLIALVFVGPGQELGRSLNCIPNRVAGYVLNLLGSCAGIAVFTALSWFGLGPAWWYLIIVVLLSYFLFVRRAGERLRPRAAIVTLLALPVILAGWASGALASAFRRDPEPVAHHWSPYYRVDFMGPPENRLFVNQIVHQEMSTLANTAPTLPYALPHLLQREVGGRAFEDVLVLGAGTGNDVSRALHFGAGHIDAVEIDPVILRLGQEYHPDHPYQDPRVTAHLEDGRRFLRRTQKSYDLIVFALVDSLVLHSGHSNIRLESYLFTQEAFADARRRLKPGGLLVIYNYFRQGWILARLQQTLAAAFGQAPAVLTSPSHRSVVEADERLAGFAVFMAGGSERLRHWLSENPYVGIEANQVHAGRQWADGRPGLSMTTAEIRTASDLPNSSDDWPFLYVRRPMLPEQTVRGMVLLFLLSVGLIWLFQPTFGGDERRTLIPMFCLGAGFMLLETRAIVVTALLLGSTWLVNAAVLLGVLLLLVLANLFYLAFRPARRWPFYAGLFLTLGAAWMWSDGLAGHSSFPTIGILQQVAPIFFSSVLFTSYLAESDPDRAIAINIIGAMAGGFLENLSLAVGFQNLLLVAVGVFAISSFQECRGQRPKA